jgi:ribosomal protein S25
MDETDLNWIALHICILHHRDITPTTASLAAQGRLRLSPVKPLTIESVRKIISRVAKPNFSLKKLIKETSTSADDIAVIDLIHQILTKPEDDDDMKSKVDLTDEQIKYIIRQVENGVSHVSQMAREMGIGLSTAKRIIRDGKNDAILVAGLDSKEEFRFVRAKKKGDAAAEYMKSFGVGDTVVLLVTNVDKRVMAAQKRGIVAFVSERMLTVKCKNETLTVNLGDIVSKEIKIKRVTSKINA